MIEEKETVARVVQYLSSWREGVQLLVLQNWVSCVWKVLKDRVSVSGSCNEKLISLS